jgi:hypothetical protein
MVRSALLHVFSMLAPPSILFRPSILLRVIREVIKPAPRAATRQNRSAVLSAAR